MTSIKPRLPSITALAFATALVLCTSAPAIAQTGPQPKLPVIPLTIGFHVVQAEVALTYEQQATGMMFRTEMGTNEGMLFASEDASIRCFWMRNTVVPLTIAFLADDGSIVNMADMQPRSDQLHCSERPVRFALEMNRGWFAKRGIKPGARFSGRPFQR